MLWVCIRILRAPTFLHYRNKCNDDLVEVFSDVSKCLFLIDDYRYDNKQVLADRSLNNYFRGRILEIEVKDSIWDMDRNNSQDRLFLSVISLVCICHHVP